MRTRLLFVAIIHGAFSLSYAQGTWTSKGTIGGAAREYPVGFSIGNYGFICSGAGAVYYNDLWQYDPSANLWTQKASLPASARDGAAGFSIGIYGYVGTGSTGSSFLSDFWQYNSSTNTWLSKASFPSSARYGAVGFAIGNYGYIGMGWVPAPYYYNDFWQYDPATDTWTKKADYPGLGNVECCCFSIGAKGYVGLGAKPCNNAFSDFWEFDPATNQWTAKAAYPGIAKQHPVEFVICNLGYVGLGDACGPPLFADLYAYNPATDTWIIRTGFPGIGRDNPFCFTIANKGYMGTGTNINPLNDCWEFDDSANACSTIPVCGFLPSDTIFCGDGQRCINFSDHSIGNPTSWQWFFPGAYPDTSTLQNPSNICYNLAGTYSVKLIVSNLSGYDTLTVSPMVTFSSGPNAPTVIIKGDTLFSSYGYTYQWFYNGSTIGGAIDSFYIFHQTGTYAVQISDSLGCESISSGLLITSIKDASSKLHFSIFSNSITNSFTILFDRYVAGEVNVFNVLGENMYSESITDKQKNILFNFRLGIYFVQVKTLNEIYVQKIIIQ